MKTIFLFLTAFIYTGIFAQTKAIYGYFAKSDGTKITGTSTRRFFEKQIIIASYTGGSDNTAIIEIEVPTSSYVADFRNMMNLPASTTSAIKKPIANSTTVKAPASVASSTVKVPVNKTDIMVNPAPAAAPGISKAVITLTQYDAGTVDRITRIIVLEDVKIEAVTDDAASGKSKIKLKGNRIGWAYYSTPVSPIPPSQPVPTTNVTKSGWNVVAGAAWTNF